MPTLQSPRIENGTIKWYEGDAFYIYFELVDIISETEKETPIVLGENDYISVEFMDNRRTLYTAKITETTGGYFPVHIDNRITNLFKTGKYHYDICLHKNNGETIQTLLQCGEIEVEGCCKCQS